MKDNTNAPKLIYWLWLAAIITLFGGFTALLFGLLSLIHDLPVGAAPLIIAGFFVILFSIIVVTRRILRRKSKRAPD